MTAQPSPHPSSSSPAPRSRRLRAVASVRRKREYFAEYDRTFRKAEHDVIEMVGADCALVFDGLRRHARSADPGQAPIARVSQAALAKELGIARETAAARCAALASPHYCKFCETAHPLVRKRKQRYPTAKSEFVVLDDCAHVEEHERVLRAALSSSPAKPAPTRDGKGQFAKQSDAMPTLFDGSVSAPDEPNGATPATSPARPQEVPRADAQTRTVVRAIVASDAGVEIPDEVLDRVVDFTKNIVIRMVAYASLRQQKAVTVDVAEAVLGTALAVRSPEPGPAAQSAPAAQVQGRELAGFPANVDVPDVVMAELVRLAKGRSSTKQLIGAYRRELLPQALRDRDGDRGAADRLLVDVLTSKRVRDHDNPIALVRDAAAPRQPGEVPYLEQLAVAHSSPDAALAKRVKRVPPGRLEQILEAIRAHVYSAAPAPHRLLDEVGLGGEAMLKHLVDRVRSEAS